MRGGNYTWLIFAILLLLVGIPIADEFDAMSRSLTRALALSCLLGIGVLSFKGSGRIYPVALVIVVIGVLLFLPFVSPFAALITRTSPRKP